MTRVINSEYVGDYKIKVDFDNNSTGVANLLPLIEQDNRKLMRELIDKSVFSNFRLNCNTITWCNGVDISPDYLLELTKH